MVAVAMEAAGTLLPAADGCGKSDVAVVRSAPAAPLVTDVTVAAEDIVAAGDIEHAVAAEC